VRVDKGQRFVRSRTFTVADVDAFTKLSGDVGQHHRTPDAEGRVMVHGLLTASLPTQVGGALDFIAREMVYEFVRPVFTGDTLEAVVEVIEADDQSPQHVVMDAVVRNQHGKEVLKGRTNGVIR
jgi:acyl dehydratase